MTDRGVLRSLLRFNETERDAWVTRVAATIPAGQRVLDVGAGTAPYRGLFAHCDYKTHDFGQEPATIGRYAPLDFISDVVSIPVPDASFDAILCTEVLEHVPDPIRAVAEMSRILRPGGRLLLSAPLGSHLHQQPFHFYGGYTPFWYQRFLPECGLDVESIEPNRGFFSLFAQEGQRFSSCLDPRRTWRLAAWRWTMLSALWCVTLPLFRIVLPLLARSLDEQGLETTATAGYHVVARKRAAAITQTGDEAAGSSRNHIAREASSFTSARAA